MPKTGASWLSPAGVGKEIVITAPIPQTMHLYLPTTLFERLKDDFSLPVAPAYSICHAAGIGDDVIDQIGRSILSELTVETAASRVRRSSLSDVNYLPAALLAEDPRAAGGRRVLFSAGSDAPAKAQVADLIEGLGFHGIDLGLLKEGGRAISIPGGALTIQNLIRLD
jgi:hypothetical protein